MNKKTIRAFAFGVIFAVSTLGAFYYKQEAVVTGINKKQAVEYLTENGMAVVSKKEYNALKDKASGTNLANTRDTNKTTQPSDSTLKDAPVKSYSLYVVKGMNSGEISKLLEEQKVIASKQEFEQFLIKNNYHTKIQLGTYDLNSKMTYQQIADSLIK